MAQGQIKAILFDLGETLLNFGRIDKARLLRDAARLSYQYLSEMDQPAGSFRSYLWHNILGFKFHILWSSITGRDFDALDLLRKNGQKRGIKLTDEQWLHVHSLWYEPLRVLGRVEPDLDETLGRLEGMGLKLGIVSNTFVHCSSLKEHLAQEGVNGRFSVELYSHEYAFRKPDRRIFLEASRQMGIGPEETMFVGDRIDKDVKGALGVGMVPVLKKAYTNEGKKVPTGVARIENISELPSLVAGMNA